MRITSRKNPLLRHIKELQRSPQYREAQGEFLGDGIKLLQSALDAQFPLRCILYSEDQSPLPCPPQVEQYFLPSDLMAWLSPMKSPQGALFVGKIPQYPPTLSPQGQYIILDSVQDPGNVGTIWRTAHGFSATAMILLGNCADPWGHKTVRSSMGACFHLPLFRLSEQELLPLFQAQSLPLYGTALQGDSVDIHQVSLQQGGVIIGNEGKGVSPSLLAHCDQLLYLPMAEHCQSLNVGIAGGIILWEMFQQRPPQ